RRARDGGRAAGPGRAARLVPARAGRTMGARRAGGAARCRAVALRAPAGGGRGGAVALAGREARPPPAAPGPAPPAAAEADRAEQGGADAGRARGGRRAPLADPRLDRRRRPPARGGLAPRARPRPPALRPARAIRPALRCLIAHCSTVDRPRRG